MHLCLSQIKNRQQQQPGSGKMQFNFYTESLKITGKKCKKKKGYLGLTRTTRSQPGRTSRPGRGTVPPSEEWRAQRTEPTNHRCPNHEEEDALGGESGLLQGLEDNLYPGGQRELRRWRRRRKVLPATAPMFWMWT